MKGRGLGTHTDPLPIHPPRSQTVRVTPTINEPPTYTTQKGNKKTTKKDYTTEEKWDSNPRVPSNNKKPQSRHGTKPRTSSPRSKIIGQKTKAGEQGGSWLTF